MTELKIKVKPEIDWSEVDEKLEEINRSIKDYEALKKDYDEFMKSGSYEDLIDFNYNPCENCPNKNSGSCCCSLPDTYTITYLI